MPTTDLIEKARKLAPKAYILCADDDKDTLGIMRQMVNTLGWTGDFTDTAQGILDCINERCEDYTARCFDAVITDINYFDQIGTATGPRLTGIGVAREIRKKLDSLPIVFASAFVNSIIREEVRRLGADIFSKPVEYDELFYVVARAIANYRELRAGAGEIPETYQVSSKLEAPKMITKIMDEVRAANMSKGGI